MERYPELTERIRFVISLYHGDELETDYLQEVQGVASEYEIPLHMISERVASSRCIRKGKLCFTNRDVLVNADLVSYLPLWEGFGNALLEAFAARVPVVTTTYLVYKTDIKGTGVRPLEIRDRYDDRGRLIVDDKTLEAVYRLLMDREYARKRTEDSYNAAAREFGYSRLKAGLSELIESYADEIRASRRRVRKSQQSYYV
jgi:glycosyltransferase involved in cell wall biosynthesis